LFFKKSKKGENDKLKLEIEKYGKELKLLEDDNTWWKDRFQRVLEKHGVCIFLSFSI
jgi:hypothetical protein